MGIMDDASGALAPHTKHLGGIISRHGAAINQSIRELQQQSDLGRPDTEDDWKFLIVNKKLPLERVSFDQLTNSNDDGGPSLGEVWLIQSICTNGQPNKSPGFNIRTNTGRLLFAIVPEGMGNETVSGSVTLLQGEVIFFEPLAEGVFDFTISLIQRKFPRQEPDAGYGQSMETYEPEPRSTQHEPERGSPQRAYLPGEEDQVGVGGDISPDVM